MARPFEFDDADRDEARLRQFCLCAHCGESLDDLVEHGHHVVPNQSGRPGQETDNWIGTAENCVILCDTCHYRVHENGRFWLGATAPPSYFPFSHGNNSLSHHLWVEDLETRIKAKWDD